MRRLLLTPLSLCLLLPAVCGQSQPTTQPSSQPTDWQSMLDKAHKHRRIMLRRAAANKLAKGRDAAVPSILAYAKQHGRNVLCQELLEAYGKTADLGPQCLDMLADLASDREFYWRSQALRAVANNAQARHRPLFLQQWADPAHLSRIQAGRGLLLLGQDPDKVQALLQDPDPRVRLRMAKAMAVQGQKEGFPTLILALRQQGQFFDYPWALSLETEAFRCLKKLAGKDFGYQIGAGPQANQAAILAMEAYARQGKPALYTPLPVAEPLALTYTGGLEIRSCALGDLFLAWTGKGELVWGLQPQQRILLPTPIWQGISGQALVAGEKVHGKVVCDYLRFRHQDSGVDQKSVPQHLPEEIASWLKTLAAGLEKWNRPEDAQQILSRLQQFIQDRKE